LTTIAYRQGLLIADGCTSDDDGQYKRGTVDKVYKLKTDKKGEFIHWAGAGDEGIDHFIEEYLLAEYAKQDPTMEFPEKSDFEVLAVFPNGKVGYINSKNRVFEYWKADYWAAGSGGDFALGAMAAGACAVGAVFAAIKHSFGSTEPVQGYNVITGELIRYATEKEWDGEFGRALS